VEHTALVHRGIIDVPTDVVMSRSAHSPGR
jgi:hypothetical protein